MKELLLVLSTLFFLCACGVKGRPLPPLEPPPLGQGRLKYEDEQTKKKKAGPQTAPEEEINSGTRQ